MRRPAFAALILCPTLAHAQMQMQPGQWEFHATVTSVDMPGAPPQVIEAIRKPTTRRQCVTPADAARGPLKMMKDMEQCEVTRQSMDNGKLDALLVCDGPDGHVTRAVITGNVTPAKFTMQAAVETTGRQASKLTGVQTGERVGDCP